MLESLVKIYVLHCPELVKQGNVEIEEDYEWTVFQEMIKELYERDLKKEQLKDKYLDII
jgi:hypothetical protein